MCICVCVCVCPSEIERERDIGMDNYRVHKSTTHHSYAHKNTSTHNQTEKERDTHTVTDSDREEDTFTHILSHTHTHSLCLSFSPSLSSRSCSIFLDLSSVTEKWKELCRMPDHCDVITPPRDILQYSETNRISVNMMYSIFYC